MDFNPLTGKCTEIQRQINQLQQSEEQVAAELQLHSSIDPRALDEELRKNEVAAEKLQSEIQALEKEIQENAVRLKEIAAVIGTLFNPFNWFANDQVKLRRKRAQLREIGNQKPAQRQSKVKELEDTRVRMAKVTFDVQQHFSFDLAGRQSNLQRIQQSIAGENDELALVADRKRRIDEVLAPLIEEMQNLKSSKCRAESDLEVAEWFERRLSSAK